MSEYVCACLVWNEYIFKKKTLVRFYLVWACDKIVNTVREYKYSTLFFLFFGLVSHLAHLEHLFRNLMRFLPWFRSFRRGN